jgi:hypothetical protein
MRFENDNRHSYSADLGISSGVVVANAGASAGLPANRLSVSCNEVCAMSWTHLDTFALAVFLWMLLLLPVIYW